MVAVDYGQLEARIIAAATQDKRFVQALWEGHDVHGEWAERLAHAYPRRIGGQKNLTDKKAMKTFRTDIKNQWTFPLFFGAALESAAYYLSIPEDVLRPHYDAFWDEYAGVKKWQEQQLLFYEKHGYIECLTGRRRHAPLGVNKILNSPIQGTAADLVMDAMSRLSETNDPVLQPELNIHDDLTFMRVPEVQEEAVVAAILDIMLKPVFSWINVPITVEVSVGKNWMPYDEKLNPEGLKEEGTFSSDRWFR
jgi:DNA polymerase-1